VTAKYRAEPVIIDGVRFASKKEGKRYGELKLLEVAREISDLICHPRWPLLASELRALPLPEINE